jgi:serine/threonine protein kinase
MRVAALPGRESSGSARIIIRQPTSLVALTTGARVGPYEIVAPIGTGGMGEVYRARDTKLHREVALNVLPEAFTLDPERLARFRREVQVLTSINHPRIAAIYGFEESEGVHAFVSEMVDGPTLADRIETGAVPLDEALPIAKQIAEALGSAHEQGILHRDLRPTKVKLCADRSVKILDLGFATIFEPLVGDLSQASRAASRAGRLIATITGTAAYMSPERAGGKRIDKLTDIWAFGCVLYEMLAGKPAFGDEDVSATLKMILEANPEWTALPPTTPLRILRLLQRCLDRNPSTRIQDIGDARSALTETIAESAALEVLRQSVLDGFDGHSHVQSDLESILHDEPTRELVANAREGDRAAVIGLLGKQWFVKLKADSTLSAVVRDPVDVERLAQEAVLRALTRLDTFPQQNVASMQAYLRQAVSNCIRDEMRRRSRKATAVQTLKRPQ